MFIRGGSFYATFRAYHFVWLKGRVGGGKTSLAFALALMLLRDGLVNEIYSNIPSVARQPRRGDVPRDCAVIIDEGGLFLKFSTDFEKIAAFMRKQNIYIILPSFIPPNRLFSILAVQRTMNLKKIIPVLPFQLWMYQYELVYGAQRDEGKFMWPNPQSTWGLYDTTAMPSGDAGISNWIAAYSKKEAVDYSLIEEEEEERDATDAKLEASHRPAGDAVTGLGRDMREAGGAITDAAEGIGRAAATLRNSARKIRRR